jgi:hypothetical protein
METFVTKKNAQDVKSISEDFENDLEIYVKLFTILYADETVLLAESAEELQSELNYFYEYCEKWNLKVNINKSKVMVFSKGRLPINLNFNMNNMKLEIVSEFIYLGTMFQKTGSFKKNKINLAEKASKAMYDILNKGRVHNLSVSCQLDLFDKIIIPMLTYGSEIWGYENIDTLEKLHVKFCKLLLNLKTSTPNFMLYGECNSKVDNVVILVEIN